MIVLLLAVSAILLLACIVMQWGVNRQSKKLIDEHYKSFNQKSKEVFK